MFDGLLNTSDIIVIEFAQVFPIRDHPFSMYAKFSQKTFISYPLIRTRTRANQGVENVSSLGNICVRTKWIVPYALKISVY